MALLYEQHFYFIYCFFCVLLKTDELFRYICYETPVETGHFNFIMPSQHISSQTNIRTFETPALKYVCVFHI